MRKRKNVAQRRTRHLTNFRKEKCRGPTTDGWPSCSTAFFEGKVPRSDERRNFTQISGNGLSTPSLAMQYSFECACRYLPVSVGTLKMIERKQGTSTKSPFIPQISERRVSIRCSSKFQYFRKHFSGKKRIFTTGKYMHA